MPGLDDWLTAARAADPEELRERILTGYKSGKPFTPYVPTIRLPANITSVLDFGCGLGRNFPYLRTIARSVSGFDLPPMIERCRALAAEPVDQLFDDWNDVRTRRFDLIFAALVLQHIEPSACRSYLADFARMAPAVYILTRSTSDFDTNVLALVAATGAFKADETVEVDHDSATNQLRVLGRKPFDVVCQSSDGGHFEVLLFGSQR